MIAGMPADWWVIAAALQPTMELVFWDLRSKYPETFAGILHFGGAPDSGGYRWDVTFSAADGETREIGRVLITGENGRTLLNITFDDPTLELVIWHPTITQLQTFTARAREIRQSAVGFTPEEIIEYYYRQRAAGGKLTMKAIAATTDFSYGYLMQKKMEYDKSERWGAKQTPKKSPKARSGI